MFYPEGELVAGVDESGVSDIAGPLVAACVILPKFDGPRTDYRIFEIDESKTVHWKWRVRHAELVWQTALAVGIGEVSAAECDFLKRRNATALAMLRAVLACQTTATKKPLRPSFMLVDGDYPVPINIKQATFRKGDKKSLAVASASIIAKVYRDEIMVKLHATSPYYDWINNKGFPSEAHFRGLDKHGIQPGVHRVAKWPFEYDPDMRVENRDDVGDHIKWRKRRHMWRVRTLERLGKEIGEDAWTSKPPLWIASPNSKLLQSGTETSGESTST